MEEAAAAREALAAAREELAAAREALAAAREVAVDPIMEVGEMSCCHMRDACCHAQQPTRNPPSSRTHPPGHALFHAIIPPTPPFPHLPIPTPIPTF